jgi:hypothetical protein
VPDLPFAFVRYHPRMFALVAAAAATLTFTTPAGWKAAPSRSSMRVAELTLPRAPGDREDAELVVYYFGGSGGSVDANINRWVAQMHQVDGRPSSAVARKETRQVNGLAVSLVDVRGTYVAETSPGSTEHLNKPNYRLRAAVVETARGPYFIKLTGPDRTIARWDDAFNQFIASLKLQ